MTTVEQIFDNARLFSSSAVGSHIFYFVGLTVAGTNHHGQVNVARVSDMGGPWVVTIYILVSAPNRGAATGFQARADTIAEALDRVERYTSDWATNQEHSTA